MAKLIKTYENGIEKIELTFRDKIFDYSMIPNGCGRTGDKPAFDTQIPKEFPELCNDEGVITLLDNLSFEDDEEDILDILEQLEGWECE